MGSWELLEESSEVAAVHAALVPNGEVVYAYGQNFSVSLLEPREIASACFIRLSAVTHAFNMSQRFVAPDFSQGDQQSIDIGALNDPNVAPPGHYLLFVLDTNGVPCVAPVIQLVYA
jgi:hypothetical protein